MDNLDLYLLADENGIVLDEFNLRETPSLSTMDDGQCYIAMNSTRLETMVDERVHLAHELGHCMTGSFYNRYAALDIRGKHERRANKWAFRHLVPLDELQKCFRHGLTEHWQLAEVFDVPCEFMQQALDYYRETRPLGA
ncbi:MAG: ImmA/IrrE family metallo-endopeptidase [Oscillospiraceae bacterium]|jgi:Zn-dependent peptidase ImmA (M78 family)|nr:ImmA/IrrE family metallo-endopeptidase [Oscillospiraceae bacterium]